MTKREAKIHALGIVVAQIESYLVADFDDLFSKGDEGKVRGEIEKIQDSLAVRIERLEWQERLKQGGRHGLGLE